MDEPLDFLIAFTPSAASGSWEATLTGAGRGTPIALGQIPEEGLRQALEIWGRVQNQRANTGVLVELGRLVGSLLLPEGIRPHLYGALLRSGSAAVRVRLRAEEPSVSAVPWELAAPEQPPPGGAPGEFLFLGGRFHLSRQLAFRDVGALDLSGPLKVLVAWANPSSGAYPHLLRLQREVDSLLAALRSPACWNVEARELPEASPARLRQRLADWQPHVLVFAGHGEGEGRGGLILHGATGAEPVQGSQLAGWLKELPIRLVVLTTCRSTRVAEDLHRSGIPAVVAMQTDLGDAAAEAFSRFFYSSLAQPSSVEEAVAIARDNMGAASAPDWCAPVLFLASRTSQLFLAARRPTPSNLPLPRNPRFTGRAQTMREIDAALWQYGAQRAALVGAGGLGKSAAASEYAHQSLNRYPGGVFWVDARNRLSVADSLARIGRQFLHVAADHPAEEQVALSLARIASAPQPTLLIYDNIEEEEALSLAPAAAGHYRILATSRAWFVRNQCHIVELPELAPEEGLALLESYRPAETEEDRAAAARIASQMSGMPLALSLVGAYVEQCDLAYSDYPAHELPRTVRQRLFDVVELSYRRLTQTAIRILHAAACFGATGISPEVLYDAYRLAWGDMAREEFDLSVGGLALYSLARRDRPRAPERRGRYSLHDIIREFAFSRMDAPDRERALGAAASVLSGRLIGAAERRDWRSVRPEIAHAYATAERCEAALGGAAPELDLLLCGIGLYRCEQGEFAEAEALLERAHKLARDRYGPSSERAAWTLLKVAEARMERRNPQALECAERALELARGAIAERDPKLGDYHCLLGLIYKRAGELEVAEAHYLQALALYESGGDETRDTAACLNNLGTLYEDKGDLGTALDYLQRSLAIDEAISGPDNPQVAIRLNNIGRVLGRMGRWDEARARHQRALEINRANFGDANQRVAASLYYLGLVSEAAGDLAAATQSILEALEILKTTESDETPATRLLSEALRRVTTRT